MEGSYLRKALVWQDLPRTIWHDRPVGHVPSHLAGPHQPADYADRLFARESLAPRARQVPVPSPTEPYTLQWFLDIENQRHFRQARWIPRLLEFTKHPGETLLGLGNGLGTDWLQYARHGTSVTVCSPSAGYLSLCRRNFELRGLGGRFVHSAPESLPLASASIDVACLSDLLQDVNHPELIAGEVFRVLKPGGKVLVVAPAHFDVEWWYRVCFPLQAWLRPARKVSYVPTTRFSARGLRRLFDGFEKFRVHKRHLLRCDVPHVWRWMPRSALARVMGRLLVLKAFKPVSSALAAAAAA
jgi:SAM-dependent methyltransferase